MCKNTKRTTTQLCKGQQIASYNVHILKRRKIALRKTIKTNGRKSKSKRVSDLCLLEPSLDFSDDPLEGLSRELMFLGNPPGTEGGAEEDVEEESRVLLGLQRESVSSLHDHQLTAELSNILEEREREGGREGEREGGRERGRQSVAVWPGLARERCQTFHNFDRVKVCLPTDVQMKQLLCIPDQPPKVDRQGHLTSHSDHMTTEHKSRDSQLTLVFPVGNMERRVSLSSCSWPHSCWRTSWSSVLFITFQATSSLKHRVSILCAVPRARTCVCVCVCV